MAGVHCGVAICHGNSFLRSYTTPLMQTICGSLLWSSWTGKRHPNGESMLLDIMIIVAEPSR